MNGPVPGGRELTPRESQGNSRGARRRGKRNHEQKVCVGVSSTTEKVKSHATSKHKAVKLLLSKPIQWRTRVASVVSARRKVLPISDVIKRGGGRGSAPIDVREKLSTLAWLKPLGGLSKSVKVAHKAGQAWTGSPTPYRSLIL
jgi:hypothetical protein